MTKVIIRSIIRLFYSEKYLKSELFELGYFGYKMALRSIWQRNILRIEKPYPWPANLTCRISEPKNIVFEDEDVAIFWSPGTYFQNFSAKIVLGKGVYIAPNVGIITANHDSADIDKHIPGEDVVIGDKCWVGMNSVILPGVELGANTIVGAGSVVTKSFPEGNVVIGGSPAIRIRGL
ncbi:acyltransferase [Vibrio tapetis subsp. quintayensis]|uniref:acyltransferase n=1 Tax=Vibrio tapetis TaxID=52443 RepID=UPI0025B3AAE3|nr:acyltransferase [Vibrio tapetis]MDN3679481.1 acyltransferase [Vibrio tapetis subsp. quintayensis]